jgi:DNA-binding beta-propeller fold protein YncE
MGGPPSTPTQLWCVGSVLMRTLRVLLVAICFSLVGSDLCADSATERHYLYVATPGIRAEAQYGGTGILVFDIDHDHEFVRRIAVPSLGDGKHANAAKGICASAVTGQLYVSTPKDLTCIDLATDKVVWEKAYESGCDRMSISPDGKIIYEPTLEKDYWHVLDAASGAEIAKVELKSGAHNTVYAADGKHCYLAGLKSPLLTIADTSTHTAERTVGPFGSAIRPFTINSKSTLCYVTVNGLLGFEIGDLVTGKKLYRVQVSGFSMGTVKRHGCPSHGVALTPDENEVWVADGHNSQLHIFDNTVMPPTQVASIAVRDQPGWITFSMDGRYAYPSTGDVIDARSRKVLLGLKDEHGVAVHSEKLLEIDFVGQKASRAGDQFGVGRAAR